MSGNPQKRLPSLRECRVTGSCLERFCKETPRRTARLSCMKKQLTVCCFCTWAYKVCRDSVVNDTYSFALSWSRVNSTRLSFYITSPCMYPEITRPNAVTASAGKCNIHVTHAWKNCFKFHSTVRGYDNSSVLNLNFELHAGHVRAGMGNSLEAWAREWEYFLG